VKAPEPAISADRLDGSVEPAAEERSAGRSRRSGRRAAPVKEQDAAEPQDEPAVVS
jgi:hypothetical protein